MPVRPHRARGFAVVCVVLALTATACGTSSKAGSSAPVTLRLGYFANLTHAPAIVGVEKGFFAQALGSGVKLDLKTFNAGPDVITAIFADALDISYIGPNPTINGFAQSKGEALRVIAGATSGGAALVVKPSINSAADLKGKKIASPQLGNTQDVALRAWLKTKGLKTTTAQGGDVSVVPQANAQTLDTFRSGDVQGAWVPEPWATRLVVEGGGKVLVDESSLWPDGKFVTTQVIVRAKFLKEHPDVVERFLRGHVDAVEYATRNGAEARSVVNAALERLTGKALPAAEIDTAWSHLTFTVDPIASSLRKSAQDATSVGLLATVDLTGLYDLAPLNKILTAKGSPPVSG